MGAFNSVDWHAVFVPKTPLLEIVVRGTLVYLALFLLLRLVLKRQSGTVAVTDLLVVVLIADAAQNAMADDYRSVPDGLLLVATIVFWSYALDWLGYRFRWLGRFIHPPPLELIRDGKVLWRNLRKELVSLDELKSQLREQGIEDIAHVKAARMEGDGRISVVSNDGQQHPQPKGANP
jgi:uncharacterized membrane protein YcaP (DUF421 family)